MAITKSAKIEAEIEKVKAKIAEQQARLKELEQKKLEEMCIRDRHIALAIQRQASNVFVIVGTPPLHKGADRRLFLPGQFTAHVCPLSLTEAAPGSRTRSRSRASRGSHRSESL